MEQLDFERENPIFDVLRRGFGTIRGTIGFHLDYRNSATTAASGKGFEFICLFYKPLICAQMEFNTRFELSNSAIQ